jgi:hypothetical protein
MARVAADLVGWQDDHVLDPLEGVTASGLIQTGASLERVADVFVPVLESTCDLIAPIGSGASLYLYGSVATGSARSPASDVDLLTIGVASETGAALSESLSNQFASICRGVEVAVSTPGDFVGEHDEAYGGRVFLHHYCVHLAGVDHDVADAGFPADARAARGFNGDIGQHLRRWRRALAYQRPTVLGRAVARKTLLAVAGLVSVHDQTWTTDRERAASRWSEIDPERGPGLRDLTAWSDVAQGLDRSDLARALDTTVAPIAEAFANTIGLWADTDQRVDPDIARDIPPRSGQGFQ